VLWNLTAFDDPIRVAVASAGAIPPLVQLLSGDSDDDDDAYKFVYNGMRTTAVLTLRNLACVNDEIKAAIVAAGALSPLVKLLSISLHVAHSHPTLRPGAAEALHDLIAGSDDVTAAVVAAGGIPPLVALLATSRHNGWVFTEEAKYSAMALCNLASIDAGRRQLEGLGYTQHQLRELLAERSPGHKRRWLDPS
jgi:hypothetical protein